VFLTGCVVLVSLAIGPLPATAAAPLPATAAAQVTGGSPGATVRRLLPDLRFAPLKQFHVTTPATGRVLLRFTTVLMNVGTGPFVVAGTRDPADPSRMTTEQWIYDSTGARTTTPTDAIARYSGDGHSHWHIQDMQTFALRPAGTPSAAPLTGFKTGFCFFDGRNINPDRAGNPGTPRYYEGGCGVSGSTSIRMGLSVGWADTYPWDIANQWIDITDIPTGAYRLCVTADIQHFYTEASRANNDYWADLTLDMAAKTVAVTASARSACAPVSASVSRPAGVAA